ncbi:Flp pilus assembly protein CpaB [Ferrimonas sp. YFM]|uniref:Flp pilus assembly protein CpaB n=1 Tax=Ferrimonas sp. YFM TaxID=3028878 RepID=UPI002573279B|nr:Flp pilus assembly protein CpaB [Ferrimonas sp. YFM]BDY04212.1 Flp pilus assembly protein CpaB [Ferrimonas sp. YFM]
MSSKVTYLIAFLAVIFGLYGILDLVSGNGEPATPPPPEVKMVTLWQASSAIAEGEAVSGSILTRVTLTQEEAAQLGANEDISLTLTPATLAARNIDDGEWVFPEQLSQPGQPGYLDLLTTEGMVLYPLTISATNLVDNYIHPGDYIDILTVSSPHTNLSNATAELTQFTGVRAGLLMQQVRVMALDSQSDNGVKPKVGINGELETTVVIEVAPQAVSRLSLAQRTMFIEIYRSQRQHPIPDADVSDIIANYTGIKELRGGDDDSGDDLGGAF